MLKQKDGLGITTFATHLAKGLERLGKSVLLVDSDPQGLARDWATADSEQTLSVVGLDRETLERDIQPVAKATEYIVIDGAARHEKIMRASLRVSDLVLIPVQPSPDDI